MNSSVYITNSPLHVLHAIALIKKRVFNKRYIIIWCGGSSLDNFFPENCSVFDYKILDLSNLKFESYFAFQKNYKEFLTKVADVINKIDYLITCFDTFHPFEALRHHYKVPWRNVGIIEDGIGNYFRSTMPILRRQIPKSFFNFLKNGYFLNMTRSNLGGNPKVGFIGVMEPEKVYKHSRSRAQIIGVKDEFKTTLKELRVKIPSIYEDARVLISLTPIFSQNRMSENEFLTYIKKILNHLCIMDLEQVIIKPHPRENLAILSKVVANHFHNRIKIADQGAIEMYLPALQNMVWAGLPSSGFLNSFLLYGNSNKFLVFPLFHKPFSRGVLKTLKKLMGSSLQIVNN